MKKIVFVVILLTLLMIQSCGEFMQIAGDMAQAAGAAYFEQTAEKIGVPREDAINYTNSIAQDLFGNAENANKGIDFVTANDKYIKQGIVANEVLDITGKLTGEEQLMNTFKDYSSVQFDYLSESSHATTKAEKKIAFDKRNQKQSDLFFDSYSAARENKAKFLAEKSKLAESLRRQGYTDEQAIEIAGSLLAVQRSSDLTWEEKQDYISKFLPNEPVETVMATIKSVDAGNYVDDSQTKQSLSTEIVTRQNSEEQAKTKAAKDDAIKSINTAFIDSYKFDKTDLNEEQKATLDRIAVVLNQYPDVAIQIKGHTCDIGTTSVNERVGFRRADNAKAYLVGKGITPDRITVISAGKKEPIFENTSAENRKHNRRLTFEIK